MKMNDRVLEKINAASDDQIVLTLGSNRLVFAQHQQWILGETVVVVALTIIPNDFEKQKIAT